MKKEECKDCNKIKLVIAGNYRQYGEWLWHHKQLKGYEVSRYISHIDKLYGYSGDKAEIVLTGTYWESPVYRNERFELISNSLNLIIIKP